MAASSYFRRRLLPTVIMASPSPPAAAIAALLRLAGRDRLTEGRRATAQAQGCATPHVSRPPIGALPLPVGALAAAATAAVSRRPLWDRHPAPHAPLSPRRATLLLPSASVRERLGARALVEGLARDIHARRIAFGCCRAGGRQRWPQRARRATHVRDSWENIVILVGSLTGRVPR